MVRKNKKAEPEQDLNCPRCGIGRLNQRLVRYVEALDDTLLTAPKFPARECDVCRYREYDEQMLEQLELLISVQNMPAVRMNTPLPKKPPVNARKPRTEEVNSIAQPRKPKTPKNPR